MNRDLIDQFEAGGELLRRAVEGLTPEQLTKRVGPGEWSIQELVIHLADTDAIAIDRMKRVICEDQPTLLNADESAYVEKLHCHEQSIDDAIELFVIGRRQMAHVLRRLPDETFTRTGQHNIAGPISLVGLIESYSQHLQHHLEFLKRKRENL